MPSLLLIEDNNDFRDILTLALNDRGEAVTEARDGAEGAKQFRAAQTDLVLTDTVMPNNEGITVS